MQYCDYYILKLYQDDYSFNLYSAAIIFYSVLYGWIKGIFCAVWFINTVSSGTVYGSYYSTEPYSTHTGRKFL